MDPSPSEDRFFAHIVDSAGWSTQFILFSGTAGQTASGTLSYFDIAGEPWDLSTTLSASHPDRAALVALYNATDGPNWVNNENWLTDAPLRDWYGVATDASGRVVRVDLAGRWDSEAQEWIPLWPQRPDPARTRRSGEPEILTALVQRPFGPDSARARQARRPGVAGCLR